MLRAIVLGVGIALGAQGLIVLACLLGALALLLLFLVRLATPKPSAREQARRDLLSHKAQLQSLEQQLGTMLESPAIKAFQQADKELLQASALLRKAQLKLDWQAEQDRMAEIAEHASRRRWYQFWRGFSPG